MDGPGAFRAVQASYAEVDGGIQIARKTLQALGIKVGDKVGLTPIRVPVTKPDKDGGGKKGKKEGKAAKGNKGAKGKKRSGS